MIEVIKEIYQDMPSCLFKKVFKHFAIGLLLFVISIIGSIFFRDIMFVLFGALFLLVNLLLIYQLTSSYIEGKFYKNQFYVERIEAPKALSKGVGASLIGLKAQTQKVLLSAEIEDEKYLINIRIPLKDAEYLEVGDDVEVVYNKDSLAQLDDCEFTLLDYVSFKKKF